MEYRKGSLGFGVRGLDDGRPAGNFALHQRGEWLLTSLCLAWNVAADIDKTPAHVVVVECPVERIGELVEDRLGHALRRKQGTNQGKVRNSGSPASNVVGTFGRIG